MTIGTTQPQERMMRRVLALARAAVTSDAGMPFGAVIVREATSQIVAEANNEVSRLLDPTAHAEVLAICRASRTLESIDLSGCAMYTNVAPCCMCMASALWARLDQVYFLVGMAASDAIGLGDAHLYEELSRPLDARAILPVTALSILQTEALDVLAVTASRGRDSD